MGEGVQVPVTLPLLDTFSPAYEVWEMRDPTPKEVVAQPNWAPTRVKLLESISDAPAAAAYLARVQMDNGLSGHIARAAAASAAFKAWRGAMPSKTPAEIARYQKDYATSNLAAVSTEINQAGAVLSPGQCLFHGGIWPGGITHLTQRPLSTSLCPQVALRNAEWNAKAYDAGRLDLWVLQAVDPRSRTFVFRPKGTNLGHEHEVLIASGAKLTLLKRTPIRSDYLATKYGQPDIQIPLFVLEIALS